LAAFLSCAHPSQLKKNKVQIFAMCIPPAMKWLGPVILSLLVSSVCFAQANVTYLPGLDFTKYHTYQWVTTKPHPIQSVDQEIKRVIDSQLTAKGLTQTTNMPDLTVDYEVAMNAKEEWSTFRYNEIDTLTPTKSTVYAGTLGVTFSDAARKQVVWAGRITKAVDPDAAAGTKQKNLEKAAQNLLRTFPPKRSSK
jgi:hypothetical protein